ncbi:MAG: Obg family GTPase CgtA, partial [Ornithinimicrobium sp.]
PTVKKARTVLRPVAKDDTGFAIERDTSGEEETFRVVGERPTRWVRQTDFTNDEAVGYLADRLNRLGVEDALFKAGAVAGSTVLIGPADNAVVFDWEPTMSSGAELLGSRGTDVRLDENDRPTRDQKRDAFHAKMDKAEAARAEMRAERGGPDSVSDPESR